MSFLLTPWHMLLPVLCGIEQKGEQKGTPTVPDHGLLL